jgi:hypothetical protein
MKSYHTMLILPAGLLTWAAWSVASSPGSSERRIVQETPAEEPAAVVTSCPMSGLTGGMHGASEEGTPGSAHTGMHGHRGPMHDQSHEQPHGQMHGQMHGHGQAHGQMHLHSPGAMSGGMPHCPMQSPAAPPAENDHAH